MKKLGLFFSFFYASVLCAAPYTGKVFLDCNNNGFFDRGDKLLEGISVSDGLHVVKTDNDGTFLLPGHARERFIFITTPSGYKTNHRYYHKIGQEEEYDFALQPYEACTNKDGSHAFIHISDTEIFNTRDHEDWIGNLRDYVAGNRTSFIIHTGDICYEKGLKEHFPLMNTANMGCPVFYAIGNHDLVKGKYGEELFEHIYGPVYYSFEVGNVHYIVTPMSGGDYAPGYTREDVYRWLVNDLSALKPGMAVVVFNHDLLTYGDKFLYGVDDQSFVDLNAHNLKAWLFGHWHINYMKKQGNVYAVSTASLDKGGIDHSTTAFRVIHMDKEGNLRSELRYAYIDKSVCIAAPSSVCTRQSDGSVAVSVNVYSSASPVKQILYTCCSDEGKVLEQGHLLPHTDWNWGGEISLSQELNGYPLSLQVEVVFSNGERAVKSCRFVCNPDMIPQPKLSEDWLVMGGNSSHTGVSASLLEPPLRLSWVQNVGANIFMSSPIVWNGKVYVASVDENLEGKAGIYALDGTTGALLWKYSVRNSIKNSIAIDHGIVFAQDAEGYLYAVDAVTGKLKWEKKLSVNGLPALVEGITAENGVVYAGTGKGLCALQSATGTEIWKNTAWGQGEGATSTLSLGDGVLVAGSQWRGLYAHDAATGDLLWSKGDYGLSDRGASPNLQDGLLYLISRSSLFILNARTGQIIVRRTLPEAVDVTSTPLLLSNEIVFGTTSSGVMAVDRETLEDKWSCKTGDALIYTAPYTRKPSSAVETSLVGCGSYVFFGASDGSLYGLDAETGNPLWKYRTGAPVFGSVAVSGNTLIAVDFSGNVYAFVSGKGK